MGREEIPGVEIAVANEFEQRSVQIVRTGLGNDVDDRAAGAAILRIEVVGLHAEFGERVGIRKSSVEIGDVVLMAGAVQLVGNLVAERAIHRHRDGVARAGIRSGVGSLASDRSRRHEDQRRGIASVERKLLDVSLGDHLSQGARFRIDHGSVRADCDLLRGAGHREFEANSSRDVDIESDALLCHGCETGSRYRQIVDARRNQVEEESALRVGCGALGEVGGSVCELDCGFGDRSTACVRQRSSQACRGRRLRKAENRRGYKREDST